MMEDWKYIKLGEIIHIKHGYGFKGEFFVEEPNNNFLLTPGNFAIGGGFKSDKMKYYEGPINDEFILSAGDVLVTMTDLSKQADTLGYSAKIPNDPENTYLHNQRLGLVSLKTNDFDIDYIYWLLRTQYYQKYIAGSSSGATVKHTSPKKIYSTKLLIPESKEIQRKIASILSAYDDLIENNLNRIKLCCELADTKFNSLFIQLDDWQTIPLYEYADYLGRGVTPKYEDGTGFYGINQKANKGLTLNKQVFKEYEIGNWVPLEKYAYQGDVLINSLGEGTIGRVHYYVGEEGTYPVDQHMTIFRAKEKPFGLFIYQFFNSEFGQAHLHTLKKGGTNMTMLNVGDLRKIKLKVPNQAVINEFYKVIQPLYDLKSKLEVQNENLKEARDILLPRLMTGMIDLDQIQLEYLHPTST